MNIDNEISCLREQQSLFSGVCGGDVSKCFTFVYSKHYIGTQICINLTIMCMFALPFCKNIYAHHIYCIHCVISTFWVANTLLALVVHFVSKSEKPSPPGEI